MHHHQETKTCVHPVATAKQLCLAGCTALESSSIKQSPHHMVKRQSIHQPGAGWPSVGTASSTTGPPACSLQLLLRKEGWVKGNWTHYHEDTLSRRLQTGLAQRTLLALSGL
jgi:hypothetical protein